MQRPAVAADEERRARDEDAQLGERAPRSARCRPPASAADAARAPRDDPARPPGLGGPDVTTMRRRGELRASAAVSSANESAGQRRNGLPALTCIDDELASTAVTPAAASTPSTRAARRPSRGISDRIAMRGRAAGCRDGASRSHWFSTEWRGRSSRGRCTRRCTSSRGRRLVARRARGAPLSHVSHALRGPPCKSMARSKRRRAAAARARSRRASRRQPRVRSTTMTSSTCGIAGDDGRGGGSTR